MLSLSRLRFVHTTPPITLPRTPTARFVIGVWVVSVVVLLVFVVRHVSRVPFFDEYCNLHMVFGTGRYAAEAYWLQHNEHRIPLPKLVYVAAVRLSGYDFAPVVVNAALLTAASVFLLAAVRRVRGRFVVADALIPLAVLNVGNWENILCGFQVQFILSTVLVLAFLALVVSPGFTASARRVAAAGFVALLLPLCGANGVALAPALGVCQLFLGWRNLRSGDAALRRPGWLSLLGGVACLAMVPVYFAGIQKVGYTPPPPGVAAVAVCFVNALGIGLGPVTLQLHPPGYDGLTAVGVAVLVLVVATGMLLLRATIDPRQRTRAVAIGCVLGGLLCLAGGLAYGRSGYPGAMAANRYATLTMPVLVVCFFAWTAFGRTRAVPLVLCAVVALAAVPNARSGFASAAHHATYLKRIEFEIKSGVPVGFVVDRNPYVFPTSREFRRSSFEMLRDNGVEPFRRLAPDPAMTEESVPVRVLRTEGMTESAGEYRVTRTQGTLVLALPRRQHVYALRLVYEIPADGLRRPPNVLSWGHDGRVPPAPGCGNPDQLVPTDGPTPTLVLVDHETDLLRIDIVGPGTRLRVHGLGVLSRVP